VAMVKVFAETAEASVAEAKKDDEGKIRVADLIQQQIQKLDEEIHERLNDVLHDEAFRKLEATWRGLHYLISNTMTSATLKIRVLDIGENELIKDLEAAVDFDQSQLFKKVYEEEYGTLGGKPYGCLVGDYAFKATSRHIKLLTNLAKVASAAHAPFIAAADPDLFDMDDFSELPRPRDLGKIFEATTMADWRALRESEDSRYLALLLPRVLMREPYSERDNPVDGIPKCNETVGASLGPVNGEDDGDVRLAPSADHYVWGNPAYVFAARITDAFSKYGWTAAIRGVEGGGKVEGLPLFKYRTARGDRAIYVPTEVTITDRREKELSDQGFISLVYCKDTNYAAFFGGQTLNKPKKYDLAAANSNAELSARLPYILNASRFAHYIKVMMRDKVGSFATKENVQAYLTSWISGYVLLKDDAGQDLKAQYPLREARIDVSDIPGRPGEYNATIFLRPHFQLEGLTASLRLVAELPAPAA
jgi:type VI secretion system protein ImpC